MVRTSLIPVGILLNLLVFSLCGPLVPSAGQVAMAKQGGDGPIDAHVYELRQHLRGLLGGSHQEVAAGNSKAGLVPTLAQTEA